jgi:glycosyltransferase involved in cell wall biosynthesis
MGKVIMLRSSNGFYGAERVIVGLSEVLPSMGWDAELWVLATEDGSHQPLIDQAEDAGISTVLFPCGERLDLSTISGMRRRLAESGADVVHSNDVKSNFYARLATKGMRGKLVSTLHGWTSHTKVMRSYEYLDRLVLRKFDAVISVTDEIARSMNNRVRRLEVIENGVDTRKFTPENRGFGKTYWGTPDGAYLFGILARLTIEKGHSELLSAFQAVCEKSPRAHLMITGSGPELASIESRIDALGLSEKVALVPAHMDVDRALRDLDCYVSPSLTEGMPMVVLEAMASGIPVIATNVGAVAAMLGAGGGIVVEPKDTDALSRAMEAAISQPDRMRRMADVARERVVDQFSLHKQVREHACLYDSLRRPD